MAKYDAQLSELKNILPNAKSILIALPKQSDIDRFAAGLALFLSFEDQGKQVSIVCDDTIRVVQANLFGIDHVRNMVSQSGAGNYILTLAGVATPDPSGVGGKVSSLEKLDYFVEGSNLNLVFNVLPGQTFAPSNITPHYQGSGYDVIFVLGSASLIDLGNIYAQNSSVFQGPHIINIDNETDNAMFGKTNVVDSSATTLSEITTDIISNLGLPFDQDMATNLLAGIFSATSNLMDPKVTADTYLSVSTCLRVGGKKPTGELGKPAGQGMDLSPFLPASSVQRGEAQQTPVLPVSTPSPVSSTPFIPETPSFIQPTPPQTGLGDYGIDMSPVEPTQPQPEFTMPPIVPSQPTTPVSSQNYGSPERPSQEERPMGEAVVSSEGESEGSFEPGWLTPKVFKGTSMG